MGVDSTSSSGNSYRVSKQVSLLPLCKNSMGIFLIRGSLFDCLVAIIFVVLARTLANLARTRDG